MNERFTFHLAISYHDFMPYYQGRVQSIVVFTEQGLRVQFPASHLRRFLTSKGVNGKFCLMTKNKKFFSLDKLND
jgi:hypothetical protein